MTTPKCFKNSYVKVGLMVVIIAVLATIAIFLYFNKTESSGPSGGVMSQKLKLQEPIKTTSLKSLVAFLLKGKFSFHFGLL
jgi:hypothetical protein